METIENLKTEIENLTENLKTEIKNLTENLTEDNFEEKKKGIIKLFDDYSQQLSNGVKPQIEPIVGGKSRQSKRKSRQSKKGGKSRKSKK